LLYIEVLQKSTKFGFFGIKKYAPSGNPGLLTPFKTLLYTFRKPETGNRKPETGNRKPENGKRKPENDFSFESGLGSMLCSKFSVILRILGKKLGVFLKKTMLGSIFCKKYVAAV
jgi:hypothetical protein